MAKFSKAFKGVKDGDIYPTSFAKGADCPPELEEAAASVGALAADKPQKPTNDNSSK
ncbi:hypothetical protein ABZR86_02600 [Dyella marensis]|uniref:Uncharacterized protein n=1 Tax=Dyella marensis TaxID=500610 RepID=A0A1I1ZY85_9GAMM|nr:MULTISPECIES: hypothetical protein [Dyella]SFE36631.1 hypothetical protein SAMN02799615_00855 [Dyella marensis]